MRVALIKPRTNETRPLIQHVLRIIGGALPTLAAYTPKDVELTVIDESIGDQIPFDRHFDLVGLSVMTPAAPRAYELARDFRRRGSRVVMGGSHITVRPDEALVYADAVALYFGEEVWPQIVADVRQGTLKPRYEGRLTLPENRRTPDRSVLRPKQRFGLPLTVDSVATSVGCPYTCSFCMIPVMYGRQHSSYGNEAVIEDIRSLPGRRIYFNDDNIMGDPRNAADLFQRLIRLQETEGRSFEWYTQTTIVLGYKPELAAPAAKAGCRGVYIGFESVDEESVRHDVRKGCNKVPRYAEAIAVLRNAGIKVEGGFVFGFDHDDESIFERTLRFVEEARLDSANFHILTPYPGTAVYDQLKSQGRIFDDGNWARFYTGEVVFQPARITPRQLQAGYDLVCREAYGWRSILRRARNSARPLENLIGNTIGRPRATHRFEGMREERLRLYHELQPYGEEPQRETVASYEPSNAQRATPVLIPTSALRRTVS